MASRRGFQLALLKGCQKECCLEPETANRKASAMELSWGWKKELASVSCSALKKARLRAMHSGSRLAMKTDFQMASLKV